MPAGSGSSADTGLLLSSAAIQSVFNNFQILINQFFLPLYHCSCCCQQHHGKLTFGDDDQDDTDVADDGEQEQKEEGIPTEKDFADMNDCK